MTAIPNTPIASPIESSTLGQTGDHDLTAAVSVVAGRELLRRVVTLLSPIPVVALKGVVISALTEGSGAAPRRMIDVDVLIPASARDEAEGRLRAAGFKTMARTQAASTLRHADLPLDLDLHVRLTQPGLFALDEAAIIERSQELPHVFAFAARIPDRHDLYAHLVAHFVRNRSNADDIRRLSDFAIVAKHLPIEAGALRDRMLTFGLGRAARYTLTLAADQGDELAARMLDMLPADPLGSHLAKVARAWLRHFAGNDVRALLVPHLLNRDLPAGAASLAHHILTAARRCAPWASTTTATR